ncbi:MAG: Signal peptidase peptidase [Thermoanaerobaculia bacterium]|jgi:hypothetical protein|nr:Signal peptidase peptidase [Thermoanaerobaculia bacterium]
MSLEDILEIVEDGDEMAQGLSALACRCHAARWRETISWPLLCARCGTASAALTKETSVCHEALPLPVCRRCADSFNQTTIRNKRTTVTVVAVCLIASCGAWWYMLAGIVPLWRILIAGVICGSLPAAFVSGFFERTPVRPVEVDLSDRRRLRFTTNAFMREFARLNSNVAAPPLTVSVARPESHSRGRRLARRVLVTLMAMCLAYVITVSDVIRWYTIHGSSMSPSYPDGCTTWTLMCAYQIRLPLTRVRLTRTGNPAVGDPVIVLNTDGTRAISRIQGVAGEPINSRPGGLEIAGRASTCTGSGALVPGSIPPNHVLVGPDAPNTPCSILSDLDVLGRVVTSARQ